MYYYSSIVYRYLAFVGYRTLSAKWNIVGFILVRTKRFVFACVYFSCANHMQATFRRPCVYECALGTFGGNRNAVNCSHTHTHSHCHRHRSTHMWGPPHKTDRVCSGGKQSHQQSPPVGYAISEFMQCCSYSMPSGLSNCSVRILNRLASSANCYTARILYTLWHTSNMHRIVFVTLHWRFAS